MLSVALVPELQGEPDDIARDKCRLAAEKVGGSFSASCLSLTG